MRVFLHLLVVFGALALLGLCGWRLVGKASNKGYRSPMVGVLVLISILCGIFVGLQIRKGAEDSAVTIAGVFAVPLFVCLLAGGVIWMLPRRDPRRPGRRRIRFPYRFAGFGLIGIGLLLGLVVNLKLFWPMMLIASFCLWIGRRAAAPSLDDVLGADSRPPVLYLRPFEHEQYAFAMIPWGKRKADFCTVKATNRFEFQPPNPTLEEYFSEDLRLTLGPLVALGNPRDFVPPIGAARTYSSDEEWQDAFKKVAQRAVCILSGVDVSPSLSWELQYLRETGLQEKLFIVSAPYLGDQRSKRFRQRAFLLWIRINDKLTDRMKARPSWGSFAGTLKSLGYTLSVRPSRPGAVLTFDKDGRAILLCTGARTTREYIRAIQAWITEKRVVEKDDREASH
jgi:hypothetical protein